MVLPTTELFTGRAFRSLLKTSEMLKEGPLFSPLSETLSLGSHHPQMPSGLPSALCQGCCLFPLASLELLHLCMNCT